MSCVLPLAVVPFPPKLLWPCPLSVDVWSTKHWKKLLSLVQKPERFKDVCNHLSIGLNSLDRLQPLLLSLPHKHCKHCSVGRSRDSQTQSHILKIRVYRCKFAGKQGLLTTSHVYWPSESSRGRELLWWRDRRYSTLSLLLQTQTTVRQYGIRGRWTLLLSINTSGRKGCWEIQSVQRKKHR